METNRDFRTSRNKGSLFGTVSNNVRNNCLFTAPLFDAYQENLLEKDNLILDYEKQFENMNKKSKEIVSENKTLTDKVKILEDELVGLRQSYKKVVIEKETADIEKATLVERAERAESKLKEVYELYEDKSK